MSISVRLSIDNLTKKNGWEIISERTTAHGDGKLLIATKRGGEEEDRCLFYYGFYYEDPKQEIMGMLLLPTTSARFEWQAAPDMPTAIKYSTAYAAIINEVKPDEVKPDEVKPAKPSKPKKKPKEKPVNDESSPVTGDSVRTNVDNKTYEKSTIPGIRQSLLNSYTLCPYKAYTIYENNLDDGSIFTGLGTAIHGVMEDYYSSDNKLSADELFNNWWAKHATPDWKWYSEWRTLIDNYFAYHKEIPNSIIALELGFSVKINGVPVTGTIDRIDRIDDDTIALIDYKSNLMPFAAEALDNSIQFQLYTLAVQQLKEQLGDFKKVICVYDLVRLGYKQSTSFEEQQLSTFSDWVAMMWDKIRNGYNREPQINQYCGYCKIRGTCPAYKELLKSAGDALTPAVEMMTVDLLAHELDEIKMKEKIVKQRRSDIEQQIKAHIVENDGSLPMGDYELTTSCQTRYKYDTNSAIDYLINSEQSHLLKKIVSVQATPIKSLKKTDPVVFDTLEAMKVATYTAPSITKKKIKPVKASDVAIQVETKPAVETKPSPGLNAPENKRVQGEAQEKPQEAPVEATPVKPAANKIDCRYCGKNYSKFGITNHEKTCKARE